MLFLSYLTQTVLDAKVATLNGLIPIEGVLDYNKQFLSFIQSRVSTS